MAAYNFQKQFVPLIESGKKCFTIRQRRKNGYLPRPGDVLRLYNGMRTKSCKLIREAAVIAVTPITINAANGCADVVLNGTRLQDSDVYALACSDGFNSIREFAEFFAQKYGGELSGYLIQWQRDCRVTDKLATSTDSEDPPVVCDYCKTHGVPPRPLCERCARLCDAVLEMDDGEDE